MEEIRPGGIWFRFGIGKLFCRSATSAVRQDRVAKRRQAEWRKCGSLGLLSGGMAMRRREFIAALGGAAAWPVVARAQQPSDACYWIYECPFARRHRGSAEGLSQRTGTGRLYRQSERQHRYRWARGDYSRLPVLANELIGRHIDVLVATGGDGAARAAKEATATIPVVFNMGSDPVKAGLVKSFNQPGGNVTGSVLLD